MNYDEMNDGHQVARICVSSDSTLNGLSGSESTSSDEVLVNGLSDKDLLQTGQRKRSRTISTSKRDDVITTESGQKVYTKGRPPWYDRAGKRLKKSYLIGICGGSASGKTTVAKKIIERLEMPWVTILSMDSFYKVLNEEQHELAAKHEYNFDHPDAFDFSLLHETLVRLRDGKSVEVPVYDFTTHRRERNPKLMYGADILIFEGILSFHKPEIADLMDMKVFVDTDSDTRLARRLERDIAERGRDVAGVLEQYLKFVKPAFDMFIAPGMKIADIIVPRGGENHIAIDLIVRQIKNQLTERGYYSTPNHQRQESPNSALPMELPPSLKILGKNPQLNDFHRLLTKNGKISREEFLLHSEKLTPNLIAETIISMENGSKLSPQMQTGERKNICGVTIMRAGESMEKSLRLVVKDCRIGKILIQTNHQTHEPELYYLRLPKNISQYRIILMDSTVATGAAAMMAIRILLDHDVQEEDISLISLLMAEPGVHSLAYAFPKVKLLTTTVDAHINEHFRAVLGVGDFGDRCFGDEAVELATTDDEEEQECCETDDDEDIEVLPRD